MQGIERWVELENARRRKEKGKELLSPSSECQRKATELASFWPSSEWMTPDKLLEYVTLPPYPLTYVSSPL